jgi:penicillin-binding protein-related factor A (putative recombinase)
MKTTTKSLEKPIENQILVWLKLKGALVWKNQTVGVFDPTKKIFRKSRNPFHRKGVSDILGIWRGRPLAIEVKSAKGYASPEQKQFIKDFTEAGGIAFIARSVEDVEQFLMEPSRPAPFQNVTEDAEGSVAGPFLSKKPKQSKTVKRRAAHGSN